MQIETAKVNPKNIVRAVLMDFSSLFVYIAKVLVRRGLDAFPFTLSHIRVRPSMLMNYFIEA